VVYGIEIPRLLALLAFHNPNATVKGLDIVPLADQPPVNVVRFAFQAMVGIGTLLAVLGLAYLYVRLRRGQLPAARWFYRPGRRGGLAAAEVQPGAAGG
jgi:cytochrome bd ubiquinol oxidase subunit I